MSSEINVIISIVQSKFQILITPEFEDQPTDINSIIQIFRHTIPMEGNMLNYTRMYETVSKATQKRKCISFFGL